MRNKRVIRYALLVIIIAVISFVVPRLPIGRQVGEVIFKAENFNPATAENTDVNKLLLQIAELNEVKAENETLRESLNFYNEVEHSPVFGYILSREPFNQNFVTLNVGTNDGVEVGQPLVVGNGIIIGKVLKVEPQRAQAELLTSNISSLITKNTRTGGLSGLAKGTLGSTLALEFIESTADIQIDDLIVTSGTENKVPAGLVVGVVEAIEQNEGEVFKTALIKPAVSYNQQRVISVIIEP